MSRIADELYFAPNVRFADLDLTGARLPIQFRQRIRGFYLDPAMALAKNPNTAFAAGVLVVCTIDFLAWIKTGSGGVTARIIAFCKKIPDLADGDNAAVFCEHFRNGLVHEGRVKRGSEFNVGSNRIAVAHRGRLVVNPLLLAQSVAELLNEYIDELHHSPPDKNAFRNKIRRKFRYELEN